MSDTLAPDLWLPAPVFMLGLARSFWRRQRPVRFRIPNPLTSVPPAPTLHLLPPLERTSDAAIDNLIHLLSPQTAESLRTTAFTIALARQYGFSDNEVRVVARGAYLRRIGYRVIPQEILHKQAPLTLAELRMKRGYCQHGYNMLRQISQLASSAEIVYAQHESWDGIGYPRGLRGENIPLGARMLAVADMLEAITSRSRRSEAQAIAVASWEIELCSGHRLDPECVQMFLGMPSHIWIDLRTAVDNSGAE